MLNTEKIFSLAKDIESAIIKTDDTGIDIVPDGVIALQKMLELCRQDIKEQAIKEKGGNELLRRTKAAQKTLSKQSVRKLGAHMKDGYQMFTDAGGHIGFALYKPLDGLPQVDNGYDVLWRIETSIKSPLELTEINLSEVELCLKEHKSSAEYKLCKTNKPAAYFMAGEKAYNPEYILTAYEILGGNVDFYQQNDSLASPAYLESENGKAILAPILLRKG